MFSTGGIIVIAILSLLNVATAIAIFVFIVRLREKSARRATGTPFTAAAPCDRGGGSERSSVGASCGEQDVPRRYLHGENVYETAMNLLRAHQSTADGPEEGGESPAPEADRPSISRQTSKV